MNFKYESSIQLFKHFSGFSQKNLKKFESVIDNTFFGEAYSYLILCLSTNSANKNDCKYFLHIYDEIGFLKMYIQKLLHNKIQI